MGLFAPPGFDPLAETRGAHDLHAMESRAIPSSEGPLARLGRALVAMLLIVGGVFSALPDMSRMAERGASLSVESTSLKALTHQSSFVRAVDLRSEPQPKVFGPVVASSTTPFSAVQSQGGAVTEEDTGSHIATRPARPASQAPPIIA